METSLVIACPQRVLYQRFLCNHISFFQPNQILPKKKGQTPLTHEKTPSSITKTSRYLQELLGNTSVSVTWQHGCLLPETLLRQLQPPRSGTSSSQHKVCVIPRADLFGEGEERRVGETEGEEEEGKEVDEKEGQEGAASRANGVSPSNGWEVADLEATPDEPLHLKKNVHSKSPSELPSNPLDSPNHLNIHFHCTDSNTLKVSPVITEFSSLIQPLFFP